MKKLTLVFAIISLLSIASCGKTEEVIVKKIEKTPLLIQTQVVWKKTESYSVEKSARLTAWSSLTLAAESVGEVSTISVKEWSKIKRWTRLISLRDTVNSYDIRVAQAQNSVSIQDASTASTRVNLDRAVFDSQIAYEQAKRSYDTLISKTKLSYDTIVNSNTKTLDNLDANYKVYLADIEKNLDQILYESDKILGLSTVFENVNNNFESQLGARVWSLKVESDNSWGRASSILWDIRARKLIPLTPESARVDIELIQKAYELIIKHVDDMIYMLQNNVISWSLSQDQNNIWLGQYSGFRAAVNGSNAGFVQWKTQTLTFLKNYKLNELATKVAVESLDRKLTPEEEALIQSSSDARLLYNTTIIDLKDRIATAKLTTRQAENARDTALKSRETTLTQLWVSRQSWVLSLEQAQREYSKLIISAPFDGTVTRVIATPGQRVNPWTPIIEVVSNTPEVVIDLDADIANTLTLWDTIQVKVEDKIFEGAITAISRSAGANLLYTTRISVPDATGFIGTAASIVFAASREVSASGSIQDLILPLRSVKIISEQEWEIALLWSGNTLIYMTVSLGKIVGDGVYIRDTLDPKSEVILSDVSNYDKEKFFLEKKKN
jgi:multidrug resistance efflux pump